MLERIPEDKALQSAQVAYETAQYLAQGGTITPCRAGAETWQLYAVANGEEGITLKYCKVLPDLVGRKERRLPGISNAIQRAAYRAAREKGETPDQARVAAKTALRQYTKGTKDAI